MASDMSRGVEGRVHGDKSVLIGEGDGSSRLVRGAVRASLSDCVPRQATTCPKLTATAPRGRVPAGEGRRSPLSDVTATMTTLRHRRSTSSQPPLDNLASPPPPPPSPPALLPPPALLLDLAPTLQSSGDEDTAQEGVSEESQPLTRSHGDLNSPVGTTSHTPRPSAYSEERQPSGRPPNSVTTHTLYCGACYSNVYTTSPRTIQQETLRKVMARLEECKDSSSKRDDKKLDKLEELPSEFECCFCASKVVLC
uniref:Uncharacterized protein n=1 Tax=Timema douglasi TaxID=61478 RepID=A0A7R8VZ20_TIMDO|nr:unnamed protein product [Timema douglasi]